MGERKKEREREMRLSARLAWRAVNCLTQAPQTAGVTWWTAALLRFASTGQTLMFNAAPGVSAAFRSFSEGARGRVLRAGQGWCAATHHHDNSESAIAAADEALTILDERITAALTPALNTGTAWDALILTGTAVRELRSDIHSDALIEREMRNAQQVRDADGDYLMKQAKP